MQNFNLVLNKCQYWYGSIPGVISIEGEEFGADVIVIMIDDKRLNYLTLPWIFFGFKVEVVGIYELISFFEKMVAYCRKYDKKNTILTKYPGHDQLKNLLNVLAKYKKEFYYGKKTAYAKR